MSDHMHMLELALSEISKNMSPHHPDYWTRLEPQAAVAAMQALIEREGIPTEPHPRLQARAEADLRLELRKQLLAEGKDVPDEYWLVGGWDYTVRAKHPEYIIPYSRGKAHALRKIRESVIERSVTYARALIARLKGEWEAKRCAWTYDETHCAWDSSCGETLVLEDGGPSENEIRFCHGCGKPVEVACKATPEKARQVEGR